MQLPAGDPEPVDVPIPAGVEHVQEITAHGDAGGERATGRDDLAQRQVVAVHLEDVDRVAARVDADQQVVCAVVQERALRGELVRGGAGGGAARAAGRVGARLREQAVGRTVVDDDLVSGEPVRLDEDGG